VGFRPSGRDEVTVRGYLLRGELVVSTFHRRARWWYPTEKRKAAEIARALPPGHQQGLLRGPSHLPGSMHRVAKSSARISADSSAKTADAGRRG
jgi:hypothetical protein